MEFYESSCLDLSKLEFVYNFPDKIKPCDKRCFIEKSLELLKQVKVTIAGDKIKNIILGNGSNEERVQKAEELLKKHKELESLEIEKCNAIGWLV